MNASDRVSVTEPDFRRAARLMKVLADETRAQIITILASGEHCACHLQGHFALSQPTLSHHLKVLVESGLVAARQEGKWVHYRLERSLLGELASWLGQLARESANTGAACDKICPQDPDIRSTC